MIKGSRPGIISPPPVPFFRNTGSLLSKHRPKYLASDHAITARVATTSEDAECPLCHRSSARIHSRYVREVADLPWMGCAVRLELHVRRFFCLNPQCARQIFTERLPTVVAPYARRTTRLTDVFTLIVCALGGKQESA